MSLVFLLFIFASCDPLVEYNKVIQNDSDYDVKVLTKSIVYIDGKDTVYTQVDTIPINKGSSAVVFTFMGIGSVHGYKDCRSSFVSMQMLVYFSDVIKEISNIQKKNNWNYRLIKECFGGGECECRMRLTNEILITTIP